MAPLWEFMHRPLLASQAAKRLMLAFVVVFFTLVAVVVVHFVSSGAYDLPSPP